MELKNRKLEDNVFFRARAEALAQWPTGAQINLEEGIAFQKSLPVEKSLPSALTAADAEKRTLLQPRSGSVLVDRHIQLLEYLREQGGADVLSTTIDSYTRQSRFREAQSGIEESERSGKSMLNGFPAVNHGVDGCRRVTESVGAPIQVRHGSPDARLLAETALAGGFTGFEGGGISFNIPYAKGVSLEKTILDWQYVDRLVGIYEEAGVAINREPFGPLTGALVPPCISHAVSIIESLLAAEQGVRNITVGYGQCGNLIQDVAALQTLRELTREYLHRYGYRSVSVTTVLHQWMGGFPQEEARAYSVISWGSVAAALAHATRVMVKTPHEATGVPTGEAIVQGLLCTGQIISMLEDQSMPENGLQQEKEIIAAETRCIVDRCLQLGEGDIAVGAVRAFQTGVLDVPFAPSRANAGKLLPARDNDGAVRILEPGALPLSKELLDFNRDKIEQRATREKRKASFQMVIDDIYAISTGRLVGRPR